MDKIYYRKLIRDRVPLNMDERGVQYETRVLGRTEFLLELLKKAGEEASALPGLLAAPKEKITAELADLMDVIDEIKVQFGISGAALDKARNTNYIAKGGFKRCLFLEWSQKDGYQSNEKRG